MPTDPNEFRRDKEIDPNQLDLAAAMQAELFLKWAERAVEARAALDRAKLRLSLVEARLSIQCRQTPEDFGLMHTTEASIEAGVKTHSKFKALSRAVLQAKTTSNLMDVAVEAMDHRKRMIEGLIKLHGQSYFAGPSVPRDLCAAWTEEKKRTEQQLNTRQAKVVRKRVKANA